MTWNRTPVSIKFAAYKTFGSQPEGFDDIRRFNILIGRNNVGKSTMLDAIEYLASTPLGGDGSYDGIPIGETPIALVTRQTSATRLLESLDSVDEDEEQRWISAYLVDEESRIELDVVIHLFSTLEERHDHLRRLQIVGKDGVTRHSVETGGRGPVTELCLDGDSPLLTDALHERCPIRVRAERDIVPEPTAEPSFIGAHGENVTAAFEYMERCADIDVGPQIFIETDEIVLPTILHLMNRILGCEPPIRQMRTIRRDGKNEIALRFAGDFRSVPLSSTGSGVRSVFLVLMRVIAEPHLPGADARRSASEGDLLLFEELENNLHPAVLRRLFVYLIEYCRTTKSVLFVSTHSPIVVDLFADEEDAQIVHVALENGVTRCRTYPSLHEHRHIFDDLGVRASDILQANGLIWVEGPSDRIYVNHWIKLWSSGELREGLNYQCVFYGGSLLAHHSLDGERDGEDTTAIKNGVDMLTVNRNGFVICDRDGERGVEPSKPRVEAIIEQARKKGVKVFVTHGYEIEHYVPELVARRVLGIDATGGAIVTDISYYDALHCVAPDHAKRFTNDKVAFARRVVDTATDKAVWETVEGLDELATELVTAIRRWNG